MSALRANDLVKGRDASLCSVASGVAPGAGSALLAASLQVELARDCGSRGRVPVAAAGAPGARGAPGQDVPQLTAAAGDALRCRAIELGGCSLPWRPRLHASIHVHAKHLPSMRPYCRLTPFT